MNSDQLNTSRLFSFSSNFSPKPVQSLVSATTAPSCTNSLSWKKTFNWTFFGSRVFDSSFTKQPRESQFERIPLCLSSPHETSHGSSFKRGEKRSVFL